MQLHIMYAASGFRTSEVQIHAQEIDSITPFQLNKTPEAAWQKEWANVLVWFNSLPETNINRADGRRWSNPGIVVPGPDGAANAIYARQAMISQKSIQLVGDFTVLAGIENDCTLLILGDLQIYAVNGQVIYSDGTDMFSIPITPGWQHIVIVRRGTTIEFYAAGELAKTFNLSLVQYYSNTPQVGPGTFSNMKILPNSATPGSIQYNYSKVSTSAFGKPIPPKKCSESASMSGGSIDDWPTGLVDEGGI